MKAIISNKEIIIKNPTTGVRSILQKHLSYKDKSKEFQLRRMEHNPFLKNSKAYWDVKNSMSGCLLEELDGGDLRMPSGFSHLLGDMDVDDLRHDTGSDISLPWKNKPFDPRDYQVEAVSLLEDNWRGLINFATGLGKTLTAVHAIRKIKKKTLVLCPGVSIADNFYNELVEAFGEHKVGYYGNGKKKIRDITVGVAASVNNNIDLFKNAGLGLIISDECFPYRTNIVTNQGPMEIGKLVKLWEEGKNLPLIKSFNESTREFEYKQMTHGWRKQREDLLEIKISKRKFRCTPEHKILTKRRGWVAAEELFPGELVLGNPDQERLEQHIAPEMNDDQYQVLLGSFLGDGHLSKISNNRYRLVEQHGINQSEYCKWKASMFGVDVVHIDNNGYANKPAVRFCTKVFDLDMEIPKNKTNCPQWVIDDLDERGLAVWFMDDGHISKLKNSGNIAVCSFDEDSQIRLLSKLKSWGIDCKRAFVKCTDKRAPGYWIITLSSSGCRAISNLIAPYIHETMKYKIINTAPMYEWKSDFLKSGTVPVSYIKSVQNKVQKGRKPYVFDIEVEDNHNFIVCSKVGEAGIIAHNCHHVPASTFYNIASVLGNVGKMFGLTATDFRADGKDVMITAGVGDVLISRDLIWGIENGWLARPKIFVRNIDTVGREFKGDKLKNYKQHVLNSDIMTNQIISDINTFISKGLSVLCLVNEIAHGDIIAKATGLDFATGKNKQSQKYVEDLNAERIPGLIGTDSKIGEGTDTKNVDVLILANFVASKGALWQNLGRGLRVHKGNNKVIVVDYSPNGSKMLKRHADTRIKFYKEITPDVTIL